MKKSIDEIKALVTERSHAYANVFPFMPDDELQTLADDIAKNGLHDSVVMLHGKILDGRNRTVACMMCDPSIVPTEIEFDLEKDGDPRLYVLSKNVHRRHLTTGGKRTSKKGKSPLAMYAAMILSLPAYVPDHANKEDQISGDSEPPQTSQINTNTEDNPMNPDFIGLSAKKRAKKGSIKAVANLLGIDDDTIHKAVRVLKEAPEQVDSIIGDEKSVGGVFKELKQKADTVPAESKKAKSDQKPKPKTDPIIQIPKTSEEPSQNLEKSDIDETGGVSPNKPTVSNPTLLETPSTEEEPTKEDILKLWIAADRRGYMSSALCFEVIHANAIKEVETALANGDIHFYYAAMIASKSHEEQRGFIKWLYEIPKEIRDRYYASSASAMSNRTPITNSDKCDSATVKQKRKTQLAFIVTEQLASGQIPSHLKKARAKMPCTALSRVSKAMTEGTFASKKFCDQVDELSKHLDQCNLFDQRDSCDPDIAIDDICKLINSLKVTLSLFKDSNPTGLRKIEKKLMNLTNKSGCPLFIQIIDICIFLIETFPQWDKKSKKAARTVEDKKLLETVREKYDTCLKQNGLVKDADGIIRSPLLIHAQRLLDAITED